MHGEDDGDECCCFPMPSAALSLGEMSEEEQRKYLDGHDAYFTVPPEFWNEHRRMHRELNHRNTLIKE